MISFNKGSDWSLIEAPQDTRGAPEDCVHNVGFCSLHMFGWSAWPPFPPVYSYHGATGILMGVGLVGTHLGDSGQYNTYLSRDGGMSWKMVDPGPHVYEYGDMGGMIVAIPIERYADKVIFTYDMGATWWEFDIGEPMHVDNILTIPLATSLEFLLYGQLPSGHGVSQHFDFTTLKRRTCTGFDTADTEASDFETWSPSDQMRKDCLLGQKHTYTRRKQDKVCFIKGEDMITEGSTRQKLMILSSIFFKKLI